MARLDFVTEHGEKRQYQLSRRETVIGRHPSCDIVLADTTVSRRHLRVFYERTSFFVEDLNSQHGTLFNGDPLEGRREIHNLDKIRVLNTVLTFSETHGDENVSWRQDDSDMTKESTSAILKAKKASSEAQKPDAMNAHVTLKALLQITHDLGVSLDVNEIFPKLLGSVFQIFPQASRGYVLLSSDSEGQLIPQAIRDTETSVDQSPNISRTTARRVIDEGEAILSSNLGEDERFQHSDSIVEMKIRSIMCAPLLDASQQPLGMIQLETKDGKQHFVEGDLDVLINVANLAGQFVDHARLHETQLQFDRRERDLAVAQQVQLHFLPEEQPEIPGYEIAQYYHAAEVVGGDYFGYVDLPDGRVAIAVGDVSGKGISAALLMARLCSDVRYCLATNSSVTDAVQELDEQISKVVVHGAFITFVLCILNPATHELIVVNAGHMPPLCRRGSTGQIEAVGSDIANVPLGVGIQHKYEQAQVQLEPDDTVFLYTDGVSEATNPDRQLYGNARIESVVSTRRTAQATIDAVLDDVRIFSGSLLQRDDMCMVCFSRLS